MKKKPGRKPSDKSRRYTAIFRVNTFERNKIKGMARLYFDGDISKFVRAMIFDSGKQSALKTRKIGTYANPLRSDARSSMKGIGGRSR